MEKHFIVVILFALVVTCIQTFTSDEKMDEINHLWQVRHWDEMKWFNKLLKTPINKTTFIDLELKSELWTYPDISVVAKLKIIPLLMECGYGKKLIDFLWISTYTVTECKDLSEDDEDCAQDCWLKLDDSLKKGALTIFKLTCTYKQIYELDRRLKYDDPYYNALFVIHSFLIRPKPRVKNGLTVEEAAILYEDIKSFASFFGNLWNNACQPAYNIVSQEELQNEYEHQPRIGDEVAVPNLYDFYVDKLHFSMDFITNHLYNIGFQYEPNTEKVTFSPPTEDSAAHQ